VLSKKMNSTYTLGIHGYKGSASHDASACIIRDGELLCAVEEERFLRDKHAECQSPIHSVRFCLNMAGIEPNDVSAIASGWNIDGNWIDTCDWSQCRTWRENALPQEFGEMKNDLLIYFVRHHVAHLAAAFYMSNYPSAVCVCFDGQGEYESISLAVADKRGLNLIRSYDQRYSLGALYEAAAAYSGLGRNVPGKLMGLASYGKPVYDIPLTLNSQTGHFNLDVPELRNLNKPSAEEVCIRWHQYFKDHLYPFCTGNSSDLLRYANLAASVQFTIEQVILNTVMYCKSIVPKETRLVLSGGVALNCVANSKLVRRAPFKQYFAPPGPNDASCSIGAAIEAERQRTGKWHRRSAKIYTARLGPSFSNEDAKNAAESFNLTARHYEDKPLLKRVVRNLQEGAIVGWFQGAAEFGPRALGGRSILASAACPENSRKINSLKNRELWRPLSPVIRIENISKVFCDQQSDLAQFMTQAMTVKDEWVARIPVIVHVDNTSRPQSVTKRENPKLWDLLLQYERETGLPVLVNTSLNLSGEPIVHDPKDAIGIFLKCEEMQVIMIENIYISKRTT